MFTFTIDENNAVWGYAPEQETPCLFQPHKPNGEAWTSLEDATLWAEAWVAHMTDSDNNAFPN